MWMMVLAMAVSPMMAQEPETSVTDEEQQIDQAIDEAIGNETEAPAVTATDEPVAPERVEPTSEIASPQSESSARLLSPEEAEQEESVLQQAVEAESQQEPVMHQEPEPMQEPEEYKKSKGHKGHKHREVQTLMSGSGGFGAISVGYSEINNSPALVMGARAEWVIGHGFGLGIAGVGFTTDLQPDGDYLTGDYLMGVSGGYGGLVMEPIILGWFPVHIALPVLIGAGGITSYSSPADLWEYGDFDPYFEDLGVFFIAEVGAELEFNLVKAVRLTLFGTYRFTPELDMRPLYGIPDDGSDSFIAADALQGWSAGVRFKFGKF